MFTSYSNRAFWGTQARHWTLLSACLTLLGAALPVLSAEDGFQSLIHEGGMKGWTLRDGKPVQTGWEVQKDGILHRSGKGGDIYTERTFTNFVFEFEWKVAPGSNSGIKYRVAEYGKSTLGPEYQVLDDDRHPDARVREGRRKAAGLYDLFPASLAKNLSPVGKWNTGRIVANGSKVEHWLNGVRVLAYDTASAEYEEARAGSKFGKISNFGKIHTGRIMLQDHGDPVWYRNLRIRELP